MAIAQVGRIQIRNLQTRDCYYPIFQFISVPDHADGYYFFDEEFEEMGEHQGEYGQGYFGPYPTLDQVCKVQARHYRSIQSL